MSTLVATADPTTGTVRIDVEQTQVRDLFTRVVAGGWGNATTGQAWTTTGGVAGNYAVNGTQGTHTLTTTNAARQSFVTTVVGADMGMSVQCTVAVLALTQPIQISAIVRGTDTSNYYFAELSLNPVNPPTFKIRKVVLGVVSDVSASVEIAQNHAAGATWNITMEACGTSLKAKAWRSTVSEPGWTVDTVDGDLTTGTLSGVRSFLVTGNTNVSPVMAYDNLVAYVSQPIRLYRVTPDLTRTEVRGSPGYTEAPTAAAASATATFYDNEVPFDVDVFYEMTSYCSAVVEATSNTVNLDSDGDGWLRDPVDPTRNLRLVMDEFYYECSDEQVIVFSGLGDREYANSAGIFDTVDSPRPTTVSQTRKNLGTALALTSFLLDDIDLVEDILDPNRVLLLSLPLVYGWGHRTYGTDYFTAYDVRQGLLSRDQRDSFRAWDIPLRTSYAPPDTDEFGTGGNGLGVPGATYDDLAASVLGTTYNTLTASGETYLQVAQGVGY
jgi:hypothetical protein